VNAVRSLGVRGLAVKADIASDAEDRRMAETVIRNSAGLTCS
jgi:hypothetical protein